MHCLCCVEELFIVSLSQGKDFFPVCSPCSEELSEDPSCLSEASRPFTDPSSVVLALSVVLFRSYTEFFSHPFFGFLSLFSPGGLCLLVRHL